MDLHRASSKPDWEKIKPAQYNFFQKTSAATYGIISPANVITVIGLGLVVYGLVLILQKEFWLAITLLTVGRLLDIVDGAVAQSTGTKSALGELFDAVADKIGTILTIATLVIAGVTYWWVIAALVIPQAIIPLVVFYKKQKKITVHPTRQGKLSMATAWISIIGLLILKASSNVQTLAAWVYLIIGVSFLLGLYALWQYSTGRD